MWRFQRSRKRIADSISVEHVHYFDLNQIQTKELGHSWTFTVPVCTTVSSGMQEWSEMKENHFQPHLSIKKRQEKACSNSAWLISCKFFKDLKRAPSTWKVWLISSILQFTTAQLINKMLAHLVRRSNLSTGMNTKSLVLMRWLIRAVPWWTARMHLESDQSKLLIGKCIWHPPSPSTSI